MDETVPERGAVIEIDESQSEGVWVSFSQESSKDIKVTLTGPHSAFATLDRQLREEGKRLTFSFDAEQERMSEPGGYSLNILDFLRKDKSLRSLGIKVAECVPEFIDVNVVALVEKTLPVECFDDKGQSIRVESIDPSTISMFAPESVRTARVQLSEDDIARARSVGIEKTPYVFLAEGLTKTATAPVRIMIPAEQTELTVYSIAASLDIAMSPNLSEQYRPQVTNLTDMITNHIGIRATEEAKERYENQELPKMTLHIFDADAEKGDEEQSREVVYNFPEESVRKGEIELAERSDQPATAKFKLIRLNEAETADGRAD
ncbi:MAG: hypothetical protein ACYS8Z_19235 [Planctomycetota bacterium]